MHMYIYMYVYMCVYIYVCVFMLYMYIWAPGPTCIGGGAPFPVFPFSRQRGSEAFSLDRCSRSARRG